MRPAAQFLATLLALALHACYSEPTLEEVPCYGDGVVVDEATGASDLCCAPGPDGDAACETWYGDVPPGSETNRAIFALAVCAEGPASQGHCTLDCQPGVNCECRRRRECGDGQACTTVRHPDLAAVCADHGQGVVTECSICAECSSDAECQDAARGTRCRLNAWCGCDSDADCPVGTTCGGAVCK